MSEETEIKMEKTEQMNSAVESTSAQAEEAVAAEEAMDESMNTKVDSAADAYTGDAIKVLKGLEAVRERPSMYIGDTSVRGLHHLVYETVDNSIDEVLAGFATFVDVTINEDNSITVRDDGRGIPVDIQKEMNMPAVEVVMTVLHAGGKFNHNAYKVSGGLHGVGVSCVNALSIRMKVEVHRDGAAHGIEFERGITSKKLYYIGPADDRGTTVTFKPDAMIFQETTVYDFDTLKKRLRELAFLNSGTRIRLTDKREGKTKSEEFYYKGGIREYVRILNKDKVLIHNDVIYMAKEERGIGVEIAMQYNDGSNTNIFSYANNICTGEGGTHLSGFSAALTRTLNAYFKSCEAADAAKAKGKSKVKDDKAKAKAKEDSSLTGEDTREGLAAVISVKVPDPQFEGQTKTKLGNSEVKGIVESIVGIALNKFLEQNPETAKLILAKASLAKTAREAAKRAREAVQRKGALTGFSLPGKLADCESKNPEECELFIVEGQSAGGSAKGGRNSRFQAIIPIRGKILNVEKAREDQVWANKEIQDLIACIGAGVGNGSTGDDTDESKKENKDQPAVASVCNPDKARYHKVVIMTDADVDGSHISTLLLTFFFRRMRPMIERGYIYLAKPPLYKVTKRRNERYVDSDEQLDKYLVTLGCQDVNIRRASDGTELSADDLMAVFGFVARGLQIQQSLHRHGVDPMTYMKIGRDGLFPYAQMIVHENNGTVSETFVYTEEEEKRLIEEAEARLPKRVRPEGMPEDEPLGLHPAINMIRLYESVDCTDLGKDVLAAGYNPNCIFDETSGPVFLAKNADDTDLPLNSMFKLFEHVKLAGRKGLDIQRYKGLGEMNAEQLWETTMNPENRKMVRVTMKDAAEADRIFNLLMGDVVEPRREYIERHAAGVKDLDI